ncbi:hypothetical protein LJC34_07925, partial [Oscillospiraceae bacterium OttesenSCG-928-G22]|nr:hypothetical protein [Oscillospiraceae bacterium OttesenSCG-928-G22]
MPTNAPLSAILHLPHRASAAGQPLISEDILFRPLLSHVTAALKDAGVTRVLLASDDDLSISDHFFSEVFSVDLVSFGESAAAFLGERPAPLLFLSGALYFLPEAVSALRNAPRSRLMAADTPLPLFYLEAPTADALLALSEGDASGFSEVDGWDDTFDRCAPVESLLDVAMLNDALRDRVN